MLIFGLYETIYQMAMANGVFWFGLVFRRENGHIL